jgi:molybdenum cofactor biosynthesis enzyme MoaA
MENSKLPRIYQMETTNFCSANCNYCPHSKMTRKLGFVSLDTVQKVAEYCKSVDQHYIALHHMGEPLLHKNIAQIIQIFKDNNVVTELSTNGSHIHLVGEEILKAGIGLIFRVS